MVDSNQFLTFPSKRFLTIIFSFEHVKHELQNCVGVLTTLYSFLQYLDEFVVQTLHVDWWKSSSFATCFVTNLKSINKINKLKFVTFLNNFFKFSSFFLLSICFWFYFLLFSTIFIANEIKNCLKMFWTNFVLKTYIVRMDSGSNCKFSKTSSSEQVQQLDQSNASGSGDAFGKFIYVDRIVNAVRVVIRL